MISIRIDFLLEFSTTWSVISISKSVIFFDKI
jgi:hypothetical protein